jgi:hypothetical protein
MKQLLAAWVLQLVTGQTDQDWFGRPWVPEYFEFRQDPTEPRSQEKPRSPGDPPFVLEESSFPPLMTTLDLDSWRKQDDLRRVREWASDTTLRIPLLIPQLLLEEFLPRGVAVGPTTMLYRTSPSSSSLSLVVLDQALFHEAEFLERLQAEGADNAYYADTLNRGQRLVLRRSLMNGFRATYSLPSMTLNMILETTAEQGALGYVLTPTATGALVYLKGLDQKFVIDGGTVKGRLVLASGRDWIRATRQEDGLPAFSLELQLFELPLSVITSCEASRHGLAPAFIGLGTSLDVVEDLLGREENRRRRPGE